MNIKRNGVDRMTIGFHHFAKAVYEVDLRCMEELLGLLMDSLDRRRAEADPVKRGWEDSAG